MAFAITLSTHQLDKAILQSLTSTGEETQAHKPGYTVHADDGREFKYVQFDSSSVAAVAGAPAVWALTTSDDVFLVTADVSDGTLVPAGAFLSVLTDTYFGWIQTKGFMKDAPVTDGSNGEISAGDPLGPTEDSLWTTTTIGSTTTEGAVATEASSSGIANIMLACS